MVTGFLFSGGQLPFNFSILAGLLINPLSQLWVKVLLARRGAVSVEIHGTVKTRISLLAS